MKRKTIWKKAGIYTMTAALTVSCIPNADLPFIKRQNSTIVVQAASGYVQGTVKRAPSAANLEENGNLGWVHCNDKNQSLWAGSEKSQITNVKLAGTLAQIMNDTDTNFVYTGSEADNRKGQVINKIGGKTTFNLPASTEEKYVSVFTGSWASDIQLSVYINDELEYSNTHGKSETTSGAESYLTMFSYHTDNMDDEVRVEIETVKVYDTTYGNHSIQAIALSDKEQSFGRPISGGLVNAEVNAAPARVNLSKQGNIDWMQLDSAEFGSFNRKNTVDPGLTNMSLIGACDYVTENSKTNFVYSDGMSALVSPDVLKKALVFTGEGNGFSFNVPASVENRCLDIYTGAWAADIKVTMLINGEVAYENSFGSSDTTSGSPAKYQVLRLDYHTDNADDEVKVTVEVGKVYDSRYGNMNIGAITLGTERVEDDGSIVGGVMRNAPAAADLSADGKLDWIYLNNKALVSYNKKADVDTLISDVTLVGKAQADPISKKTKTAFSYSDGVTPETEEDSHFAYVFQGEGSGIEFSLPGSTDMKYLNFYAGAWAADVTIELLVNGKVQYTTGFGSSSTVNDSTAYQVARLQYKTAGADDEVRVRAVVTKVYDDVWGNMNVSAITVSDEEPANLEETIKTDEWNINHSGGEISSLQAKIGGEMYNIPMRTDQYSGFVWTLDGRKISMTATEQNEDGSLTYKGTYKQNGKDLTFTMHYSVNEEKQLVVTASVKNNQGEEVAIDQASIQVGFNTYLERYPDYNDQLFPTLLRCEKTHAWGYFTTPSGRIMTIATDSPVASYTLDYQSGLHRIYSASLDVLQSGKLPKRHPQDMNKLGANEEKTWNIYLKPVEDLNDIDGVKPTIAKSTKVPTFEADRYTLAQGEESRITVRSSEAIAANKLVIESPQGDLSELELTENGEGVYTAIFEAGDKTEGVYRITAENEAGFLSEMNLSIRKSWSWYIEKARQAAVEAPQKGSSHAETYYGFYSAYVAKKYFPDAKWDDQIDEKFEEVYPLMYDVNTGLPTSWEDRIQNHSTTLGIYVDKFESSGNMKELEKAEGLADFLMTKQKANGGYYNGSVDYTSVIYPAKSIMELAHVEKSLKEDETLSQEQREYFAERYELHMDSLTRAMDRLVSLDGNFDTEGQGTFEDGANSCSATQLSEFALMFPEGSAERAKYTEAARKIINSHTSHQQTQIPDSRMNGGTLRFWEAQYDVEMKLTSTAPNMMNSPHGWSAWNIYALFNMYELTGEVSYLERGMNAMGSCAQLMGYDGILNWAFISDPQRDTNFFVKDEEKSEGNVIVGKHERRTIGEEYVPMISYWWKAPKNTWVTGYTAMGGGQGSCCDNDVHEVFKALGEVALTKSYVYEKADGSFEAYNAEAHLDGDTLVVVPSEDVVSNVSVQLMSDREVSVEFYDGVKTENVSAGAPVWIKTKENAVDISKLDKDSSLKELKVSGGMMDKEFNKEIMEYSVDIGKKAGEVTITPVPSSDKAIVYVDGNRVENGKGYTVKLDAPLEEKDIKVRIKSEMQSGETTYSIKVSSMGNAYILPVEGQSASAGSQHGSTSEGPAAFVLDEDPNTIWHTDYSGGTVPMENRWIEIALAEKTKVCGVRYLPRPSGTNGDFREYEVYVSSDHGATYTKVTEGEWDKTRDWKTAGFDDVEATNVRITPIKTEGNFGSAAEVRVIAAGEEIPEEADKEDLAALIQYAQDAQKDPSYKYVVAKVREMFEQALADAAATNNNPSATQSLVDAAYDALLETVHLLEFKGNMEKLESLVVTAREETKEKYTPDSWAVFAEALQEAETILTEGNTLQAEIDVARTKLLNAIFGLREVPNKDKLEGLLAKVNAMDLSVYSTETASAVKAAYAKAAAVFEDENADQAKVDAAVAELEKVVAAARAEGEEKDSGNTTSDNAESKTDIIKTSSTGNTTTNTAKKPAKTGDTANAAIPAAAGLAAILAAIMLWKKK